MPGKGPILIIDDDPIFSDALDALLRANGFEVRRCADGESALDAARERYYRVIITDYRMPGMSGTEVARLLRAQCPDAFIIGLSADRKRSDFLEAGADAFLNKPFLYDELMSLVRTVLQN